MSRRRTTAVSITDTTTSEVVKKQIETSLAKEENTSSDPGQNELEIRLANLEAKYEKLVSALRMNGQVSVALTKFYD